MSSSNATTLSPFISIAPGRLCLFGEHQDYLGLPVIAVALPLFCRIQVTPTTTSSSILTLRFQETTWTVDREHLPPRQIVQEGDNLDFMLAALHEVIDAGWTIQWGANCLSETDIPLQSGCSSSSAFCVSWVHVLAMLSHQSITPIELAKMAHRAEVVHFASPGGTMDHVTSALGGILRIGPGMWDFEQLQPPREGVWVLADSGQPKDTLGHLQRCKQDRLDILEQLHGNWDEKSENLSDDETLLLQATRTNRNMEQHAFQEWNTASGQALGGWMDQHHCALRDGLHLSTTRLEHMRTAALLAGAWGFKVVGSGGGGCGIAWSPNMSVVKVANAMKGAGAIQTWIVSTPSEGAHISILA